MICSIDLRIDDNFKTHFKNSLSKYASEPLGIDTILFNGDKVDGELLMVQLKSFFDSEEFRQNGFRMTKEIFGDNVTFCNFETFVKISKIVVEDVFDKDSKHKVTDFSYMLHSDALRTKYKLDVENLKKDIYLRKMA